MHLGRFQVTKRTPRLAKKPVFSPRTLKQVVSTSPLQSLGGGGVIPALPAVVHGWTVAIKEAPSADSTPTLLTSSCTKTKTMTLAWKEDLCT
jgi:hypothetical protein